MVGVRYGHSFRFEMMLRVVVGGGFDQSRHIMTQPTNRGIRETKGRPRVYIEKTKGGRELSGLYADIIFIIFITHTHSEGRNGRTS